MPLRCNFPFSGEQVAGLQHFCLKQDLCESFWHLLHAITRESLGIVLGQAWNCGLQTAAIHALR
jgi:hypothetical protein